MTAKGRVTIKEVASSAGVSYQTVSKVINKQVRVSRETEERIWAAVSKLGYRPNYTARSLRARRSFTLGYSWPPAPRDQANPILDQFLQSMFQAAEIGGYYMLSFPYHAESRRNIAAYGELIDTGRVDGFVLSSIDYDDPRVLFLEKKKFPFVAFGRSNPDMSFPWIDVDGADGILQVMRHLIKSGHTRIAALAWPEASRVGNNRMEGYYQGMKEAGLASNPAWIQRGEGRFTFGYEATLKLLDLDAQLRPTAVVALNDAMATGALWAAKARGLVAGRDLAVAGFDDAPMSQYLDPPLTTVRQPIWEVGQRIIPMLLEYIEKGLPEKPTTILVKPQLVIRASTTGQPAQVPIQEVIETTNPI